MTGPTNAAVKVKRSEQGFAWLLLDRPRARNALSLSALEALDAAMDALLADDAVRVILIGSANDAAFCAGADLKGLAALDIASDPAAVPRRVQRTLLRIRTSRKPVIAAIKGFALAGGLELAMACDIRVAARSAKIGDGHLKAGVIPGAGSAAVLPRLVGSGAAKLMLYTGDLWDAERAHQAGLIDLVCDDDALVAEVEALAARIARMSPLGLAVTKKLVDDMGTQSVEEALQAEIDANMTYSLSEDFAEGLRAFAEKRAPQFVGR
nr:enoyl-CoA hydratase/isomerase family protein [Sphingomonas sp. BGYR3]